MSLFDCQRDGCNGTCRVGPRCTTATRRWLDTCYPQNRPRQHSTVGEHSIVGDDEDDPNLNVPLGMSYSYQGPSQVGQSSHIHSTSIDHTDAPVNQNNWIGSSSIDISSPTFRHSGPSSFYQFWQLGLSPLDAPDGDWITNKPMPGGPEIPEILIGFKAHVAAQLWGNEDARQSLRTFTRDVQLMCWPLNELSHDVIAIVTRSRLSHLSDIMIQTPNTPLISAFVERWQPETNSFHMPFGEMTITLHDVQFILGLKIKGFSVSERRLSDVSLTNKLSYKDQKRNEVYLASIKSACAQIPLKTHSVARGYLWHLLDNTLFSGTSNQSACRRHLNLLVGMKDVVPNMAWGAGALAYLYMQLGKASRAETLQISGCLTLLESWIYEHFPLFAPPQNSHWIRGAPRAGRWARTQSTNCTSTEDSLIAYRKQLDQLTGNDVNWTPYCSPREIPPASYYHGCICFMDVFEAYMPDRVTRQFGRVQGIPRSIIPLMKGTKLRLDSRWYKKVYSWDSKLKYTYAPRDLGDRALQASTTTPDYLEWYQMRSHVRVYNLSNEVRLTNLAYQNHQQRLDRIMKKVMTLNRHASHDQMIPPYLREGLEEIRQLSTTEGYSIDAFL